MIFRRKTYKIKPELLAEFNDFFHTYLYPNQMNHGAKLVGRWVNETEDEIVAIWEYRSMAHYESIEEKIRNSELHQKTRKRRQELGDIYIESKQDFLTSTAYPDSYQPPKQIVAVSAYITNENGDLLLVRNKDRSDTMEIPGGQVEEGETLDQAVLREVLEETGIKANLFGITGIYQNITNGIFSVVFRGEYVSGKPTIAENETMKITKENVEQYITREHFRIRVIDAMEPHYLPYEACKVRPYELIQRFEVKEER
ncbi:NUDIX domain-containing protein [Chengkuizengella sediminis]|uniref:NUDIX domain-containing protein n=1 Tax=Chengkuizengella sediminis TaxID=1885917 RepID=UPI001389ACC8|nr:NUDIX domain-containing protein [Chengkuizengella sediminis]NDI35056.1 NUDIX domain-containing protein [Chengkuizengella sediminis]